jgi:hypothetical protein
MDDSAISLGGDELGSSFYVCIYSYDYAYYLRDVDIECKAERDTEKLH